MILTQRKLKRGRGTDIFINFVIKKSNLTIPSILSLLLFSLLLLTHPLLHPYLLPLLSSPFLYLLIILCDILSCSNVFFFTFSIEAMIYLGEIALQRLHSDIQIQTSRKVKNVLKICLSAVERKLFVATR